MVHNFGNKWEKAKRSQLVYPSRENADYVFVGSHRSITLMKNRGSLMKKKRSHRKQKRVTAKPHQCLGARNQSGRASHHFQQCEASWAWREECQLHDYMTYNYAEENSLIWGFHMLYLTDHIMQRTIQIILFGKCVSNRSKNVSLLKVKIPDRFVISCL